MIAEHFLAMSQVQTVDISTLLSIGEIKCAHQVFAFSPIS